MNKSMFPKLLSFNTVTKPLYGVLGTTIFMPVSAAASLRSSESNKCFKILKLRPKFALPILTCIVHY